MESPPEGFTALYTATETPNKNCNVVGVVTDYMPPRRTKGTDWQVSFSINSGDASSFGSGWRVIFFRPENELPPLEGLGDVVVLHNIQHKEYRNNSNFLSNRQTQCTVFPASGMPKEKPVGSVKLEYKQDSRAQLAKFVPSDELMEYAYTMWSYHDYLIPNPLPQAPQNTDNDAPYLGKQGFKLLEKVGAGGFYDLVGQIVKLWDPQNASGLVTMHLTDYTSNLQFYNHRPIGEAEGNDGDEHGYLTRRETNWQGPPGQFSLTIDLWDSHAAWCRNNLADKDYVRLQNVLVSFGKESGGKLEGKMRGDRQNPSKVNITKFKRSELADPDGDLKELLERKKDFIDQFGNWEKGENHRGKKRKVVDHLDGNHAPEAKSNNSSDRKSGNYQETAQSVRVEKSSSQKRREKRKSKAAADAVASDSDESNKKSVSANAVPKSARASKVDVDEDVMPKPRGQIRAEYNKLNGTIATSHMDEPLWTVSEIMAGDRRNKSREVEGQEVFTPYDNLMFSAEVRVVDFHPRNLCDFAVRETVTEFDFMELDDEEDAKLASQYQPSDDSSDEEPAKNSLPEDTDDEGIPQKGYRWVWRFALVVEDLQALPNGTSDRMVLRVAGDGASFLLKGLEPCDLRKTKNEQTFAQLQEKLFILWGNLQEKKEEEMQEASRSDQEDTQRAVLTATSGNARKAVESLNLKRPWRSGLTNRPFRCCIKEYGVRKRLSDIAKHGKSGKGRWKVLHQIFDTTIKS